MKHLVIGALGNMGRRHTEILRSFGDTVDPVDIDWEPKAINYGPYDSVLICTPPKTHLDAILDVSSHSGPPVPIFVEKPAVPQIWKPEGIYNLSMVACNWRYCQCADMSQGTIEIGYPANQDTAYLDVIHFFDLFWMNWGKPEFGGFTTTKGKINLTVSGGGKMVDVVFDPSSRTKYTRKDGKVVHKKGPCNMFERQMRDWRECAKLGIQSLNPLHVAAERTNWLINRWAAR